MFDGQAPIITIEEEDDIPGNAVGSYVKDEVAVANQTGTLSSDG